MDGRDVARGDRLDSTPGSHLRQVTATGADGKVARKVARYSVSEPAKTPGEPVIVITAPKEGVECFLTEIPDVAYTCTLDGEPLACTASVGDGEGSFTVVPGDPAARMSGRQTLTVRADGVVATRTYSATRRSVPLSVVFESRRAEEMLRAISSTGEVCYADCTFDVTENETVFLTLERRVSEKRPWRPCTRR